MQKKIFVFGFCLLTASGTAFSQIKLDTGMITAASTLIDLQFSQAEKDSMLDGLKDNDATFEKMHQNNLSNSQPYPFTFNPVPIGFPVPSKQEVVNWKIPDHVALPADRNELAFYSVLQLASLIKNKKISSVELTKFFLHRLHEWGDTLQCIISFTEDIALSQAAQADDELKRGIYRGPLHGIPYGLKDLFAVKGTITTWGATPYKDQTVDEDAFVYSQLRKAGAVLCAKLSLGALAMGDVWFGGLTKNPWNTKTGSSGSSAGSTAATVAGLLPFAIGTETWGSIVSPSHTCGATGLRPTFGSVSRSGAMVLSWSLDKIGPICRSAEDAAIVFYYIKGNDGKDAGAVTRAFNYTGKTNPAKLRIAYAVNYFEKLPAGAAEWAALNEFKKLGCTPQPVVFPDSTIYPFSIMDPIIGAECAASFDELTRSNRDDLLTGQQKYDWPNQFRVARFIPAVEYINANRHRYALIVKLNAFMKNYDVVIVPTFSGNQMAMTNLTGHPAICMPIGFSKEGMPESITLLGNLFDEATLLGVAKAFQDSTDFNKKHPAMFRH